MHRNTDTQRLNELKFSNLLSERFECETFQQLEVKSDNDVQMLEIDAGCNKVNDSQQELFVVELKEECETYEVEADSDDDNVAQDDQIDEDFESSLSMYQRSILSGQSAVKKAGVIHKIINSPDVSSALDRTGVSSPSFAFICAAIAAAVNEDINECVLSTSTCYRRRKTHRDQIVTTVKDDFISSLTSNLVLHWDGKQLTDTTNDDITLRNKNVERLAVVVSGPDIQKIITVAKIEDGSGIVISDTAYDHVVDWGIVDKIIGICTDTTATNTGRTNGSVVLFQQLMERNILFLACRHHVFELVIGGVFTGLFGESTGPSPAIFENFRRDWHIVDPTSFKVRIEINKLRMIL